MLLAAPVPDQITQAGSLSGHCCHLVLVRLASWTIAPVHCGSRELLDLRQGVGRELAEGGKRLRPLHSWGRDRRRDGQVRLAGGRLRLTPRLD